MVPNFNECWVDFGVLVSKPNHNIKTHLTFKPITHLIGFWFFIKIWIWNVVHRLNAKHYLIYLLNINLQGFWNKIVFVPSWLWPCIVHLIYLLEKNKKMNQTIEKGKILIPFIILGARPTSPPSPKRGQLVYPEIINILLSDLEATHNLLFTY